MFRTLRWLWIFKCKYSKKNYILAANRFCCRNIVLQLGMYWRLQIFHKKISYKEPFCFCWNKKLMSLRGKFFYYKDIFTFVVPFVFTEFLRLFRVWFWSPILSFFDRKSSKLSTCLLSIFLPNIFWKIHTGLFV